MYYFLAALLLGGLFCYFWIQKKKMNVLSRYAEFHVRVLLDPQSSDNYRQYGCFIFQANCIAESLKEIVLTEVRCANKHIQVNTFDKLNFFIAPGQLGESAMRSIGISISSDYLQKYSPKQEGLVLKGYIKKLNGVKEEFMVSHYFQIEPFKGEVKKKQRVRNSTLAV
ncbi:hypothetical protein EDC17_103211 [Sphingobacterium alimentarium]|uniref:Uncharacterized protein n=1 Tax=Sphingobacterium alimentarium TaxID=797292 RepID=A0A4R3VWZ8_9SPHI|nr:hypothetical protein [Sphingobacterium alimentarium]TCV10479.1 hypothetical protein EDC17_103211 [Sphingobacterium alimentarium]